jgi:Rad3-related DNA helicase
LPPAPRANGGGRRGAAAKSQELEHAPAGLKQQDQWDLTFNIWCLNPGVVFEPLAAAASSVLLTSGTLAPLDTFAGELGLDFHVRLQTPHVVNMQKQVGGVGG